MVKPLLVAGDEVGGRVVSGLSPGYDDTKLVRVYLNDDQLIVVGILSHPVFEQSGAIFRIDLYPDVGSIFTVSELCPEIPAGFIENQSFEEPGTIYPDPFTSADPIDLREGPCGGNWHTRIWKDSHTGEEIDFVPGSSGHEDVIVDVQNVDLRLQNEEVSVNSVNLSGSFFASSNLFLENDSTIENLSLVADLQTNGILNLKGETLWENGTIGGTGSATLSINDNLIVDGMFGNLKLGTSLDMHGSVSHDNGSLELSTDSAKISIFDNGTYNAKVGGVIGITGTPNFINYGELIKTEDSEFTIDTVFENKPDGQVKVQAGTLIFNDNANLSGKLEIANASELRLQNSDFDLSFAGNFQVDGDGELTFENAEIVLLDNGLATFDLAGHPGKPDDLFDFFDVNGGVGVQKDTTISGKGTYFNQGFTFVEGGTITSEIYNYSGAGTPGELFYKYAGLRLSKGSITGDIENWGVVQVTGGSLEGTVENLTDIYLMGGDIDADINNNGSLHLHSTDDGTPLDASGLSITNNKNLIKDGDTAITLGSLTNEGTIEVLKGDLSVEGPITLINGNAFIENSASLKFIPSVGDPISIEQTIKLLSTGKASIEGEVLVEGESFTFPEVNGFFPEVSSIQTHLELSVTNVLVNNLTFFAREEGSVSFSNVDLSNVGMSFIGESTLRLGHSVNAQNGARFSICSDCQMIQQEGTSNLELDVFLLLGDIIVKSNAELSIELSPIESKPFKRADFDGDFYEIVSGNWIVEKNAALNLSNGGEIFEVMRIREEASVKVGGGEGTGNPKINGKNYLGKVLEMSVDDSAFHIDGKLAIDGIEFTVVGIHHSSEDPFSNLEAVTIYARESPFEGNGTIELINDASLNLRHSPDETEAFGTLSGGDLIGRGFLNGNMVNRDSVIPGKSPGTITINGNYVQTDTGTLEIEIFGTEPGTEYDQLIVNGTATLAGTLHIIPIADIAGGTSFEPLVATTVEGSFDRIIVENDSARESYEASIIETGIRISPTTLAVTTYTEYQDALFSETDLVDESIGLSTSDPRQRPILQSPGIRHGSESLGDQRKSIDGEI